MKGRDLTGFVWSTPEGIFKVPPYMNSAHWSVYAEHHCQSGTWQELETNKVNICAKPAWEQKLWPPSKDLNVEDLKVVYTISDEKGYTKSYWRFDGSGRCVSAEGQAVTNGKVPAS
jgi:hypothetical protein